MQKTVKIIILLIFLFVIGIIYISLTRDTNYNTSSLINKDMPEFKIISFDDSNYFTRDDIKKNNYTLINFWASWCAPCKIEHPILMKLSQKKNLVILGINFKDKEIQAKTFLNESTLIFLNETTLKIMPSLLATLGRRGGSSYTLPSQ